MLKRERETFVSFHAGAHCCFMRKVSCLSLLFMFITYFCTYSIALEAATTVLFQLHLFVDGKYVSTDVAAAAKNKVFRNKQLALFMCIL